jgi:hypothetical protein
MSSSSFKSRLHGNPDPEFAFIDPPFNFNRAGVASHPPEVTGWFGQEPIIVKDIELRCRLWPN